MYMIFCEVWNINMFCALNCGYALFKQLNVLHFEKRNSICESTAGLVTSIFSVVDYES